VSRIFKLGGRLFSAPEHTTARQDAYMVAQAIEAGVMGFAGKALDEASALQLTATVLKSGKLEYLLAGGLVEDGQKWTAASANANAEMFGDLTDGEAKAQMLTGIVDVLAHFFRAAPLSSTPSPNVGTAAPRSVPESPSPETSSIEHAMAGSGAA
jgi:hypothetical protein